MLIEGAVHGGQIVLKTMESVKADWGSGPPPSAFGFKCLRVPHQKLWPKSSNWKREQANMVLVVRKWLSGLSVKEENENSLPVQIWSNTPWMSVEAIGFPPLMNKL